MDTTNTDRIEKTIDLRAERSRVWRALTDSAEFGQWFGVAFTGPFVVGEKIRGTMTLGDDECEALHFDAWIERMVPEQTFEFRWHPHAVDPSVDYSAEPTTLVTFELEERPTGVRLTVVESGFDALPPERRAESFHRNEHGWTIQIANIQAHVEA